MADAENHHKYIGTLSPVDNQLAQYTIETITFRKGPDKKPVITHQIEMSVKETLLVLDIETQKRNTRGFNDWVRRFDLRHPSTDKVAPVDALKKYGGIHRKQK